MQNSRSQAICVATTVPRHLFHALRPQPHADGAGGKALKDGKPIGQPHENRRADQGGGIEDFFEKMFVQENLHALDHASRGLAALRIRFTAEGREER